MLQRVGRCPNDREAVRRMAMHRTGVRELGKALCVWGEMSAGKQAAVSELVAATDRRQRAPPWVERGGGWSTDRTHKKLGSEVCLKLSSTQKLGAEVCYEAEQHTVATRNSVRKL